MTAGVLSYNGFVGNRRHGGKSRLATISRFLLVALVLPLMIVRLAHCQSPNYSWRKCYTPRSTMMALGLTGHILASEEAGATITIRNSDTAAVLGVLSVPEQIRRIRISGDGQTLAVTTWAPTGHNCQIYDVPSRTLSFTYSFFDTVGDISRDGRFIVVGDRSGTLRVYEYPSQQLIYQTFAHGSNAQPTFSPDGNSILANSSISGGPFTELFYIGQANPVWTVAGTLTAFSEDGSMVSGYFNNSLHVYGTANGALLFQGPAGPAVSTFSLDSAVFFGAYRLNGANPLLRYKIPSFGLSAPTRSFVPPINELLPLPNGTDLLANSYPYLLKVSPSGAVGPPLGDYAGTPSGLAFSPNGAFLALGNQDNLWLVDSATGAIVSSAPSSPGQNLQFSRSGGLVLSRAGSACKVYSTTGGVLQLQNSWLGSTDGEGISSDISDDEARIAIGYLSSAEAGFTFSGYEVRDRTTGAMLHRTVESGNPYFIKFLASPKQILLGLGSNLRIENWGSGELFVQYTGVGAAQALSPDRSMVAVSTSGGVRFVRLSDGVYVGPTLQVPGSVRSVSFSGDGQRVLTVSSADIGLPATIMLWSFAGQLLASYSDDVGGALNASLSPLGNDFGFNTSEGFVARAHFP
jgi:WD40 repeat protein